MLVKTPKGRDFRCRRRVAPTGLRCRECGDAIPEGAEYVHQRLAKSRDEQRRYCARCSVARGLATVAADTATNE